MATRGTKKYNYEKPRSRTPRGLTAYKPGDKYTADVFHRSYTPQELLDYRRKLAKVANQRLVRLERGTSLMTGKGLTYGAYDLAQDYLKVRGRNRFSESARYGSQANLNEIRMEIVQLEQFLNAKSSTVAGFHQIEQKRIATTAERLGMATTDWRKMSAEEQEKIRQFYEFMESETYKKLAETFSSEFLNDYYRRSADAGADHDAIMTAFEEFRATGGQSYEALATKLEGISMKGSV